MADNRNFAALDWLIHEIGETLKEARQALEAYVENPKDAVRIRFCLTHIHQVYGSLQMVEFFGAAMLAEEMERLTQAMIQGAVSNPAEAQEVLMRAILQFPVYLEQVKATQKDNPLVVLPLLNDLRSVRGESLFTDTKLFVPNLAPAKKVSGERLGATQDNVQFQSMVLKLRQMYQYAAAGYIRSVKSDENLAYLQKVFSRLQKLTQGTARYALWDICLALAEALEVDAIEMSSAIKNLLRQLDKEIKILAVHGTKALNSYTNDDLIKNLLYYVARAGKHSPGFMANSHLQRIYELYNLDEALIEGKESGEEHVNMLTSPDNDTLRSVVEALKLELDIVKHTLETCLSGGDTQQSLNAALPVVKRMADTMAVLGLGDLRKQVLAQGASLEKVAKSNSELTQEQFMSFAGKMVEIEHSLDALLEQQNNTANNTQANEGDITLTRAKESVLRESRNGLENAKDSIIEYIASQWDRVHLQNVPNTLREIRGGLDIMPLPRAARILGACARYVEEQLLAKDVTPQWSTLDTLADAITSVEYYLERLSSRGPKEENDLLLTVAEESVASLGYAVAKVNRVDEIDPEINYDHVKANYLVEEIHTTEAAAEADEASLTAAYQSALPKETTSQFNVNIPEDEHEESTAVAAQEQKIIKAVYAENNVAVTPAVSSASTLAPSSAARFTDSDDDIDEEIIEIFVEEAGEVMQAIAEYFPRWANNFDDQESLTEFRRAFHTLKGSGRMVHANDIGELSWSIENMLNRVIDNTIQPNHAHITIIEKVRGILPSMIEAFKHHSANPNPALSEHYREMAVSLAQGIVPEELVSMLSAEAVDIPNAEVDGDESAQEITLTEGITVESIEIESVAPQAVETNNDIPLAILEEDEIESIAESFATSSSLTASVSSVATLRDDNDEDAQLWDIFGAEAETHLAVLQEFVAHLEAEAPYYEAPTDSVQRALHTLKGSAHMAEITPIAELATPLEKFVKELRSYHVSINDDTLQLLRDAVSYTQAALKQIEEGEAVEIPRLQQFIARVHELREIHIAPLVRQEELDENGKRPVDPELLSIFMAEEMNLLLDADKIIAQWRVHPEKVAMLQPVLDELRNLTRGAHHAYLPPMVNLGEKLEQVYTEILARHLPCSDAVCAGINDAHIALLDMVDAIAAGQNLNAGSEAVYQNLDKLLASAGQNSVAEIVLDDEELIEEIDYEEVEANHQEIIDDTQRNVGSINDIDFGDAIEISDDDDLEYEEVAEADSEEEIIALDLPAEVDVYEEIEEPNLFAEPIDEKVLAEKFAAEKAITEKVVFEKPAQVVAKAPAPAPVKIAVDDDFDPEIVEIFIEEADELIEDIERALHEWQEDWNNSEPAEELKRCLHTFKGGARLAGLKELGDLSHNFESMLIDMDTDTNIDQTFFNALNNYQDSLHAGVNEARVRLSGELSATQDVEETAATAEVEESFEAVDENTDTDSADITNAAAEIYRPTLVVDNSHRVTDPSQKPNVLTFAPKAKPPAAPLPKIPGGEFTGSRQGIPGSGQVQHLAARRTGPQEVVKVSAELLEELVNLAGETSISRGRMEQQVSDLGGAIQEMDGTIHRMQEQLRRLDIETEAQVLFQQEQMAQHEDFDPLEMDRYSQLQQLSRSLIESASDLMDLKYTLADKTRDTETLLLQQSRINTDLQEGLMRSRMVPFSRLVPRLRRIVRQAATELGKEVDFELDNVEGELDRTVLERMVAPLEHMLRNAVDHGIESPEGRAAAGKPAVGRIILTLGREGGDVMLRLADDGRGINLERVREKAIERGLMAADAPLSDQDLMQFILHAGFSTADKVTQISGRGVGMDVVHSEIKQLGGAMLIDSRWGEGTEFIIRLPFTVSVNRALMVQIGDDLYAIPLNTIEGIVRVSPFELEHYYQDENARFDYAGENYLVRYLGTMLDSDAHPKLDGQTLPLPVILVRSTENTVALQVDRLLGSREIVVKTLGAQFSAVRGVSGATVTGDGSVVVILDLHALIREQLALGLGHAMLLDPMRAQPVEEDLVEQTVMVVDDSVTVRKVTGRFLEREGYRVITAKDGVEALQLLQDHMPDVMLLDIEMPRMDGFEVAKNIRTSSRLRNIPIIMITSRTGEKHRDHAFELGVNKYMGKPYQEDLLLANIQELMKKPVK